MHSRNEKGVHMLPIHSLVHLFINIITVNLLYYLGNTNFYVGAIATNVST